MKCTSSTIINEMKNIVVLFAGRCECRCACLPPGCTLGRVGARRRNSTRRRSATAASTGAASAGVAGGAATGEGAAAGALGAGLDAARTGAEGVSRLWSRSS